MFFSLYWRRLANKLTDIKPSINIKLTKKQRKVKLKHLNLIFIEKTEDIIQKKRNSNLYLL